jgi:flagellar motor switch protein FliM
MNYRDIISKSLQETSITALNVHPIDNSFLLEINYDIIINAIVDDLENNGYTIISKHQ